jgi:lysophospholipase L1-like esterase
MASLAAAGCVTAAPRGNVSPPRIALVGDSWPLIMRFHGGFKEALVEEGYRPRQVRNVAIGWSYMGLTETRTSFKGIESYRFIEARRLDTLEELLERYPTIDIIHLSLGGADLLHDMPPRLPPYEQEAYLRKNVVPNIEAILSELTTTYPNKLVALVGYDYLNFSEVRFDYARTQERWEELGRPSAAELNEMSWRLNQIQQEVAARYPTVVFIDCLGLTKERLAANESFSEPSPRAGLWKDGMHLSRDGNAALARLCLDSGYREKLFPLRDARGRVIRPTGKLPSPRAPDTELDVGS